MGKRAEVEDIHPSLWRGAQLARAQGRVVETGYPVLARELPGGGWPTGALIDLIVTQSGVGELRPSSDGLTVDVVKRRGPVASEPISVPLRPTPVLLSTRRRACVYVLTKCSIPSARLSIQDA